MSTTTLQSPEVRLPLATVSSLEAVLGDASPRLLTDLGQENGERLSEVMEGLLSGEPTSMSVETFWEEVGGFFADRGWASLRWEQPHPGIGLVRGVPEEAAAFPARFFAATLEGFLSSIAGARVAVAPVTSDVGSGEVVFAVGGPATVARFKAEEAQAGGDLPEVLERI